MSEKLITCIWYDRGQAKAAAEFYMTLGLPDSRIEQVLNSPTDNPSVKTGEELFVNFTLCGRAFAGLNGGPAFPQTEAVSIMVVTEDQAETDRLWDAIIGNGGTENACGWCKDRWGVNWQITPRVMLDYLADTANNPARSKAVFEAMNTMIKIDIAKLEAAASHY